MDATQIASSAIEPIPAMFLRTEPVGCGELP